EACRELLRLLASAGEAGPVAGRQRRHLVEEEELRPAGAAVRAVAAHDRAAATLVFACADDPGFRRPSPAEQRLRRRVVDDAAISREQAARVHGMDIPERVGAVSKWHRRRSLLGVPVSCYPCPYSYHAGAGRCASLWCRISTTKVSANSARRL